jgi:hypothetical protein
MPGTQPFLDFPLGCSPAFAVFRQADLPQPEVTFDRAHQHFLSAVVVTVAGHRAVELDPIRQQVNVFMVGIRVPGDDVLVLV